MGIYVGTPMAMEPPISTYDINCGYKWLVMVMVNYGIWWLMMVANA